MATKNITKLTDKLSKIGETFSINIYDNGFLIDANGRDKKGDYLNAKILCNTLDDLLTLVREACEMERDS